MIYILHGEDTLASYNYLVKRVEKSQNDYKIKLADKNTTADFNTVVGNLDIFAKQKILICENFISANKIKAKDLQNIPANLLVIFWEQTQLASAKISLFKKFAQIENFKPRSYLYSFLDSLSPNPARALKYFFSMEESISSGILWHLANRTLLMILAKKNLSQDIIQTLIGRKLEKWQWDKIRQQASQFTDNNLIPLYNGIIKLDFIIKSGQTALKEKELIPVLLLKYLRG